MPKSFLLIILLFMITSCELINPPTKIQYSEQTPGLRSEYSSNVSSISSSSNPLGNATVTSRTLTHTGSSPFVPPSVASSPADKTIDQRIADAPKELRKLNFMKYTMPRFEERINIEFKDATFDEAIQQLEKTTGTKFPLSISSPPAPHGQFLTYRGSNVPICDVLAAIAHQWGYEMDFTNNEIILRKK